MGLMRTTVIFLLTLRVLASPLAMRPRITEDSHERSPQSTRLCLASSTPPPFDFRRAAHPDVRVRITTRTGITHSDRRPCFLSGQAILPRLRSARAPRAGPSRQHSLERRRPSLRPPSSSPAIGLCRSLPLPSHRLVPGQPRHAAPVRSIRGGRSIPGMAWFARHPETRTPSPSLGRVRAMFGPVSMPARSSFTVGLRHAEPPSPRPSPRRGEGDRLTPCPRSNGSAEASTVPFSPPGRRCTEGRMRGFPSASAARNPTVKHSSPIDIDHRRCDLRDATRSWCDPPAPTESLSRQSSLTHPRSVRGQAEEPDDAVTAGGVPPRRQQGSEPPGATGGRRIVLDDTVVRAPRRLARTGSGPGAGAVNPHVSIDMSGRTGTSSG